MKALKNREKAAVVDDLKGKYPLPVLLDRLGLARSSYYYQESLLNRDDKYTKIRQRISIDTFIAILNDHLIWYNEKQIKVSLGYMSPKKYRHSIGLAA